MKKYFTLLFVVFCFCSYAQTVTYQDLLDQKPAKELTGKKGGDNITAYVASDGVTYKIGSTITYGYPTNGKYYVYFQDATGSWVNALTDNSQNSADAAANREVAERVENRAGGVATIKRIECLPLDPFNKLTSGCKIRLVLNRGGLVCTNFEEAISTGEIKTQMKTSDAALLELKQWKEKLDLQLITQEEYDAKKAELMQYIK